MKITIWNLKGGQGKTVLSLSLAMEYGFYVVTNDVHSPIDEVLGEDRAFRVGTGESFPDVPDDLNLIYDLGGYADSRVIESLEKSDVIIVPIIYESPLEMQVTINAISEIEEINNNIIIVANKCQRGDFERTQSVIAQFFDYPILEIKKSTGFSKSIELKKSLSNLISSNPLFAYHYKKPLNQISQLMNLVNQ